MCGTQQERDDAENRLTGPEHGIPVVEEPALRFENAEVDVGARQFGVDGIDIGGEDVVAAVWRRAEQRVVQLGQLGHFGVARVTRPIGETMVMRV